MAQESVAQKASGATQDEAAHQKNMLGPILCWAVVFADIGTSVYYTPGILYQTHGIGSLAGFFVLLTMVVFVLLTMKYAEVTHRFPQGGGVVSVAASALNRWFGALGGMFILVDYFLTAAISCLSGILYLSVVVTVITPALALWITVGILVLLGILNWVGISESARVSFAGAIIAFLSDIAILVTVFTHISLAEFFSLFPRMFANHTLTLTTLLAGFAGAFLAFSGLESISQLSPVMKHPHKKVAGQALLLVILTIGITSPLLTMLSTVLLPDAANNAVQNSQLISLLAGHWGNIALQTEVAISASALLVFASNTAIIGAYHVFMALSRMGFLPGIILQRNRLRGTPHFSIALATGIPIVVLIAVAGNITYLGDMYAFGLLGAFTLTCLGLDIVRWRDWQKARMVLRQSRTLPIDLDNGQRGAPTTSHDLQRSDVQAPAAARTPEAEPGISEDGTATPGAAVAEVKGLWFKIEFFLGILTTLLVGLAWCINLVDKRLATEFGGGVTLLGMVIAYLNYVYLQRRGRVLVPVVLRHVEYRLPDSILAVLMPDNPRNESVIHTAINSAKVGEEYRPVMFLYIGEPKRREVAPQVMEIVDPYLEDQQAKEDFAKAEGLALKAKIPVRKYVYILGGPEVAGQVWQIVHPKDTILPAEKSKELKDINPDRIRVDLTQDGQVAHLLKRW
ncbi:MAG TPA: APC family permease [Ktedonobacteraceae bacterium]|nr:APC family permease [Ktedonobacteraceae bacterium]